MPYSGNAESQFEKLPSFMAYCKKQGQEAEKGIALVKVIWFPNQFQSVSLDTEKFRLRISTKTNDSIELIDFLETAIDQEKVLFVRVTNAKDASYEIDILEAESAEWEQLGQHGYKAEVRDRPKAAKRAKAAKSQT